MDRISDLPDELICIIVSFLSAKSAAFTTILSKKWLNLFTIEPDLVFDQSNNNRESFQNFVDGLLNRPASYRIRRFSLRLRSVDNTQYHLINNCLCNVLKRGVMDIELDINVKEEDGYLLPLKVFSCKTIEKLKLGSGFAIDMIPRNALLPALKTLILVKVRFDDLGSGCAFTGLLSACPVIYELVINGFNWEHWKWSRIVCSLTLKRLTIWRGVWDFQNWSKSDTIGFETPNLAYLEYSDILLYEYPIVNLNSLVEANLELFRRYDYHHDYNLMNLVKGLKNVEILRVDTREELEHLFYDFSESVPVFENLVQLTVISEPYYCWSAHQVLFERSPKLKTLTLEGTLHYNSEDVESVCDCLLEYSFLSSRPIEVLKITDFRGDMREMVQMKHVLEKSPRLKLLEVHIQVEDDEEKLHIKEEMLMFPRASSNCEILVTFSSEQEL